jgi:hypothetical protein
MADTPHARPKRPRMSKVPRVMLWLLAALCAGAVVLVVYGTVQPGDTNADRNVPGATTGIGKDRLQ